MPAKYLIDVDLPRFFSIWNDEDYLHQIMQTPPPKVIHVRLGNVKMRQFHDILSKLWPQVIELNSNYKLVNLFHDRLEGIE